MNTTSLDRLVFRFYDLGWQAALPFLKRNHRIAEGFNQRQDGPLHVVPPIDLWLQAASAGESYLVLSILEKLQIRRPAKILVTTNTRQGFDILNEKIVTVQRPKMHIFVAYFPFDRPDSMFKVVNRLHPRLTVLIETELWPGLLLALKRQNLPVIIVNGRLSPKSLKHYLYIPKPLRLVAPQQILAISKMDAERYRKLFNASSVATMNNIKFDRIFFPDALEKNPLSRLFKPEADLIVLGSVREEEEPLVEKIISSLIKKLPKINIALFPRHMHRLDAWEAILKKSGYNWIRRSAILQPVSLGSIILWDTFGELSAGYALAKSIFVGGSLAKLGGQNFLEPLAYGIRPIIGPYWDNFFWIEEEIFRLGLVTRCKDWQEVATGLVEAIKTPFAPQKIKSQAQSYIQDRQGGTLKACALIESILK